MHLSKWKQLPVRGNAAVLAGMDRAMGSVQPHCFPGCRYKESLMRRLEPFPAPLCWVKRRGVGPAVPSPPTLNCAAPELAREGSRSHLLLLSRTPTDLNILMGFLADRYLKACQIFVSPPCTEDLTSLYRWLGGGSLERG